MNDKCDFCPKPSTIGTHGISDGEIHDQYYCHSCYNKKSGDQVEDAVDDELIKKRRGRPRK